MKNELFERALQNTSINDVSLAEYVKENYLPISVLDKIKTEIEETRRYPFRTNEEDEGLRIALEIIERRIKDV